MNHNKQRRRFVVGARPEWTALLGATLFGQAAVARAAILLICLGSTSLVAWSQVEVVQLPQEAADWSDTPNVPGHFATAQQVCDAKRALNWPTPLTYFQSAVWHGQCRDASQNLAAFPTYGAKCPLGYSIPFGSYIGRWEDFQDNRRWIYYAPGVPCTAAAPVLDRWHDRPNTCSPRFGNPILPLTGSKRVVIELGRVGLHTIQLSYDTRPKVPTDAPWAPLRASPSPSFGVLWESSLHKRIVKQGNSGPHRAALASRGLGEWVGFVTPDNVSYAPSPAIDDRLFVVAGGWRYIDAAKRSEEIYAANGFVTSVHDSSGHKLTYSYTTTATPVSGLLASVQDEAGRTVSFAYEQPADVGLPPRVTSMTTSGGAVTSFSYDVSGNLSQVTWPDLTTRQFLYEDQGHAWALTGEVHENSARARTYGYDSEGRAINTQAAEGVDRYAVTWSTKPGRRVIEAFDSVKNVIWRDHVWVAPQGTTVTLPTGQSATLGAVSVLGTSLLSSRGQPAGSGCGESTSQQEYDANGNVASQDDFDGHRTCFSHDQARNLEQVRVVGLAAGSACTVTAAGASLPTGSRKVSTEWHPDWRLKTQVAEPHRRTTYIYNGQSDPCAPATALLPDNKPIAVLCKQVEQATTDTNGAQGFAAPLQAGVPDRVRSWTYNEHGQVLTEKDPLNRTTTYEYHSATAFTGTAPDEVGVTKGDLKQVTNAAGHITRYTKYNRAGQALETVDPNNVVTTHTYDARQRLTSTTVGTRTTTYAYWPTGLLKQVTQPDGSYVQHEYDDAHRLKASGDNLGNRIEYELDAAGNRKAERVADPSGVLRRQLSRVFDALGRVEQTTGRE